MDRRESLAAAGWAVTAAVLALGACASRQSAEPPLAATPDGGKVTDSGGNGCTSPDGGSVPEGQSFATPGTAIGPAFLETGQTVTSRLNFFKSGYSASNVVPPTGLTATTGVVVIADAGIFMSAQGTGRVSASGEVTRLSTSGGYYIVLAADGNLYTDMPMDGNAIIRIGLDGGTSLLASNLSPRVGALHHLAASPDGFIYADVGVTDGGQDFNRMIRINIWDGGIEFVSDTVTGAKVFDDGGTLHVASKATICRMTAVGQFEPVVRFKYPAGRTIEGMLIDSNGDFLVTEGGGELAANPAPGPAEGAIPTRVFRIERATGNLYPFASGFGGPRGLARDADGTILVAEFISGGLKRIAPDGGISIIVRGNFLANNTDVTLMGDGSLIVTNAESGLISRAILHDGGTLVEVRPHLIGFNLYTGIPGQYAFTSVIADKDDNLFVAEYGGNRVVRVNPDFSTQVISSGIAGPVDLAFAPSGNLIVSTGGSLYLVYPDGGNEMLANNAFMCPFGGVVFDDAGALLVSVSNGSIVRIAGPF